MGKNNKGRELGKGLSQRKDGRYEARAIVNGIKIDIYDFNLTELKNKFAIEKEKALNSNCLTNNKLTLSEWFKEWFSKYKSPILKSDVSRVNYERRLRNTYIKVLGIKKIKDITHMDIQMATNEIIAEKYSSRTVKEALGTLRECFEIAILNKIVNHNPCTMINIRTENVQQEKRVLTHKEQEIFLNEIKNSYYEIPYKILLLTGMRIGEFSGLQWQDIDWDNKCIHINRSMTTAYLKGKKIEILTSPKTQNSYRTIPLFEESRVLLRKWQIIQNKQKEIIGKERWRCKPEHGDLVFTSTLGSPVTRYVLSHDLKKIENNINLKETSVAIKEGRKPNTFVHIHPHIFRHTFATRCFEKGLEPIFVQSIMGHANYSTTLSYTHLLDEMKVKELEKIKDSFLN